MEANSPSHSALMGNHGGGGPVRKVDASVSASRQACFAPVPLPTPTDKRQAPLAGTGMSTPASSSRSCSLSPVNLSAESGNDGTTADEWEDITAKLAGFQIAQAHSTPLTYCPAQVASHAGNGFNPPLKHTNGAKTALGGAFQSGNKTPIRGTKGKERQVDDLREQILATQAHLAQLNGAYFGSNSADTTGGVAMDEPRQGSVVQDFSATRHRNVGAVKNPTTLLEGSVPDFTPMANPVARGPLVPGIIGQSYAAPSFGQPMPVGSSPQLTRYHHEQGRNMRPYHRSFGDPQEPSFGGQWSPGSYFPNPAARQLTYVDQFGTPSTPMGATMQSHFVSNVRNKYDHSVLSPTAAEFAGPAPWNAPHQVQTRQGPEKIYLVRGDTPNYRRLLAPNISCNWKFFVDEIVCNNDQQASIFMQHKLKNGSTEQRFEIIQAILEQAYPLMVNRFGNFLIQRCFEHGNPEQIAAIARSIRGNTLNLSMDAFGCHVVQKAFDCAPEEYKTIMVHELLRRIPETVIHRYACHVWQKLFELRWNGSPPQIMKFVNEALRGMWHEVALGETGSLVVQNIFENCMEEDKRPCVNEVLASIDVIAHGQFGNWCIQHICEHGSPPDRARAVDHVLRFATEYSMDQFASKVVEKCLKIGGNDFLDAYLNRVCEVHSQRPRMSLINIAGDQFGNYLVQHVLNNADPHRRAMVATHVRRHMVSLRGSKYGSRVALLCTDPAVATRPGPGNGTLDRAPGGSSRGPWSGGRSAYDRGY